MTKGGKIVGKGEEINRGREPVQITHIHRTRACGLWCKIS